MDDINIKIGGTYGSVTAYEIQRIETFLTGTTKLISHSQALKLLAQFEPEIVPSPDSPSGYFTKSTQAEQVYNHYYGRYERKLKNKRIENYEQLINDAIAYCERHELS